MDEGMKYYLSEMDNHKKTGYLFGVIPFKFKVEKNEAVFLLYLFFFLFGILTDTLITSTVMFILTATEYSRVFDYRQTILEESVMNEEMFKILMRENGVDPNFPHDPLYVTEDDLEEFLREALYLNRSYNIFKRMLLFIVTGIIHRT